MLLALAWPRRLAAADPAWHAAGWTQRAVVSVTQPDGPRDVAAVNILHEGHAAAEGKDYRIFDAAGQPVPYEVTYHHPARDSWISFRAAADRKISSSITANRMRRVDPQRATPAPLGKGPPDAGPAAGGWIPAQRIAADHDAPRSRSRQSQERAANAGAGRQFARPRRCRLSPGHRRQFQSVWRQRLLHQRLSRLDRDSLGRRLRLLHGVERSQLQLSRWQGSRPLARSPHRAAWQAWRVQRHRRACRRPALRRVSARRSAAVSTVLSRLSAPWK